MRLDQLNALQHVMEVYTNKFIDEVDSSGGITYICLPFDNDPSIKTSDAKWAIVRLKKTGFITIQSIAGKTKDLNFNQVCDNRATEGLYTTFA